MRSSHLRDVPGTLSRVNYEVDEDPNWNTRHGYSYICDRGRMRRYFSLYLSHRGFVFDAAGTRFDPY